MKLNLGSGRKPLKDFINVDAVVPPVGEQEGYQFIQDDVMVLADIPDNSCDTICAFHLFEHLPPRQAELTLFLWYCKLKQGGELIMEMPDIKKCCQNILDALDSTKPIEGGDLERDFMLHRLGLVGLYGEPLFPQDKMEHLWGYEERSLSLMLERVGFKDIRFTDPQTKPEWSKRRDLRVEARRK